MLGSIAVLLFGRGYISLVRMKYLSSLCPSLQIPARLAVRSKKLHASVTLSSQFLLRLLGELVEVQR